MFDFIREFKVIMRTVGMISEEKGWRKTERNEGELIALEISELCEALEWLRIGNPPSDHIPEFSGAEEEFADAIIRIMDHCDDKGYRVAEAIIAKILYNSERPERHGGKKF